MNQPTVSIIIPRKPGGDVRALEGLAHVNYPAHLFEVLVAYGCQPSGQRNQAASQARGDILFFLDDDSQVAPDFLDRAARHFDDPEVAAVGGPSLTPVSDTPMQRAIGCALASIVGGGGVRNRYRQTGLPRRTSDSELILCNLAFRRAIFLDHGGLDTRLYPNEENELMDRLQHEGFFLVHDPEIAVYRSQRRTFRAFVRQLYGYGRGRGEQTVLTKKLKPVSLVPAAFLLYLLALPLLGAWFVPPLICYLILIQGVTLYDTWRGQDLALLPWLLLVYPTLHLAYGAGTLAGLARPRFRRVLCETAAIEVRRVKEFGQALN
jgi:succinoglycan biosynthesis protein ExoA